MVNNLEQKPSNRLIVALNDKQVIITPFSKQENVKYSLKGAAMCRISISYSKKVENDWVKEPNIRKIALLSIYDYENLKTIVEYINKNINESNKFLKARVSGYISLEIKTRQNEDNYQEVYFEPTLVVLNSVKFEKKAPTGYASYAENEKYHSSEDSNDDYPSIDDIPF